MTNSVMAYWIGYTHVGGYRAAFYYANTDSSASQVGGTQRHGLFAVARVRWWVCRNRRHLATGVPIGLRNMGGAY
jgi:hypothetical protein